MQRLPNGCTPQQQRQYSKRYRQRQAAQRRWIDGVAAEAGLTREQLLTSTNAKLVAEALNASKQAP
ncbi:MULTISPECIES: hypothetical protein [Corynebacterium]|uniref:hypothetical protein n=1 Tax=Corynebacterium TaxID=1716 RepID=UPI0008A60776|nr:MULTISPECIES: hypothetical protein [Corynebacterium]OFT77006.1 hypothetical protein HMPREF3104_03620 [Corynebacterium sp. HMSC30G07]